MRYIHLFGGGILLMLFLCCTIYVSRAYSTIPDEQHPGQTVEAELSKLELSGWDFIAGNLPDELSGISMPRSLPPYRAGADFCALALLGLFAIGLFVRRLFNPAPASLLALAVYLIAFIQLENFKNPYFEYADSLHTDRYTDITIDSHMTPVVACINGALLLFALLNIIFIFNKKWRRKQYDSVH